MHWITLIGYAERLERRERDLARRRSELFVRGTYIHAGILCLVLIVLVHAVLWADAFVVPL